MFATNCTFCKRPSSLWCQRCFESYCSRECLILDSTKHKVICVSLPKLVPRPENKLNLLKEATLSSVNGIEKFSFHTLLCDDLVSIVLNHIQEIYSNGIQSRNRFQMMNHVRIPGLYANCVKIDTKSSISYPDPNYKSNFFHTNFTNLSFNDNDNKLSEHNATAKLICNLDFKKHNYLNLLKAIPPECLTEIDMFDQMEKIDEILIDNAPELIDEQITNIFAPKNSISKLSNANRLEPKNILKPSNEFDVKLINFVDNNKFKNSALVLIVHNDLENALKEMNEILNSQKTFQYDSNVVPNKGKFIVGCCGNFWKRGIVIDKYDKHFLIFLIDFGDLCFVEQIEEIPFAYKDLPYQICVIKIKKILINDKEFYNKYFVQNMFLKIRNFNSEDSTGKCNLFSDNDELADIYLKNFEGNLIQLIGNNLWYMPPTNRDIIRITNVIDYSTVYIQQNSVYDSYKTKINKIGKSLETTFKLFHYNCIEYKIDSIVLVKINSSDYIRCRIKTKILNKNEYQVQDIDSGKMMLVKADFINPANKIIQSMPVTTFKCSLNILNKIKVKNPTSNKGFCLLKLFSDRNQNFVLEIENSIEDGITLILIDNDDDSINKLIIPLLYGDIDTDQQ